MKKTLLVLTFFALLISACQPASGTADEAARAIEDYLAAMTAKQSEQIVTLSCAAWEEDALTEIDAWATVETSLKDLTCQVSGEDGDAKLVTCTGSIQATYGNELQQFDLSTRTFRAVNEGGEWRMCGYQ